MAGVEKARDDKEEVRKATGVETVGGFGFYSQEPRESLEHFDQKVMCQLNF